MTYICSWKEMFVDPFVDVAFPLKGKTLPLDHGYALFGAVSRLLPVVHEQKEWGVFPVYGRRSGPGVLTLLPQSMLTLRLPAGKIGDVLALSGSTLALDGHSVTVGIPRIFPLQPRPALQSRFVTIKKFHDDPAEFRAAVRRQLDECSVGASASIVVGERRVLQVSSHTIVGFPVALDGLSADESVRVQTRGIGGRRHMGAGLFLPLGRRA
ncbi:MAG: type I-MYXAN CRISPR-associated protein Cas6/Cmx6 [Myxococcota bacterium]